MDLKTERELLDRTRRIETRLTKFMEANGFDTQVQRPQWANGIIHAPTSSVAIKDCLAVIPTDWDRKDTITVLAKDDVLAYITLPDWR
jgi:hypothetical protein